MRGNLSKDKAQHSKAKAEHPQEAKEAEDQGAAVEALVKEEFDAKEVKTLFGFERKGSGGKSERDKRAAINKDSYCHQTMLY